MAKFCKKIDRCFDCPACLGRREEDKRGHPCANMNYILVDIDTAKRGFPDWCPLPDSVDGSA